MLVLWKKVHCCAAVLLRLWHTLDKKEIKSWLGECFVAFIDFPRQAQICVLKPSEMEHSTPAHTHHRQWCGMAEKLMKWAYIGCITKGHVWITMRRKSGNSHFLSHITHVPTILSAILTFATPRCASYRRRQQQPPPTETEANWDVLINLIKTFFYYRLTYEPWRLPSCTINVALD